MHSVAITRPAGIFSEWVQVEVERRHTVQESFETAALIKRRKFRIQFAFMSIYPPCEVSAQGHKDQETNDLNSQPSHHDMGTFIYLESS
jgi:histone acetyltransferase (RNA polymerase elongator complex component)